MPEEKIEVVSGNPLKKAIIYLIAAVAFLAAIVITAILLGRKTVSQAASDVVIDAKRKLVEVDVQATASLAEAQGASQATVAKILHARTIAKEEDRLNYLAGILKR